MVPESAWCTSVVCKTLMSTLFLEVVFPSFRLARGVIVRVTPVWSDTQVVPSMPLECSLAVSIGVYHLSRRTLEYAEDVTPHVKILVFGLVFRKRSPSPKSRVSSSNSSAPPLS